MMTLTDFTQNLEKEFDDLTPGTLTPETNYREIKSWSSMHALIIIAFVDLNYNITLNGNDLKQTQTIKDLYELIKQKSV